MAGQLSYAYETPKGVPGGLVDISTKVCNSRKIENATGVAKAGMGVVTGTAAGSQVKLPTSASDKFEGVIVEKAHEQDANGNVVIAQGEAFSILRYGRVWVRLVPEVTVAVNDPVYLIASGDNAGLFTKTAPTGDGAAAYLTISAKFIGAADNGIAPIEIIA